MNILLFNFEPCVEQKANYDYLMKIEEGIFTILYLVMIYLYNDDFGEWHLYTIGLFMVVLSSGVLIQQLIDIHSERNKLFGEWCYLYEIYINK